MGRVNIRAAANRVSCRSESTMSTALHLTAKEFDRMVERGAFDHLQRKIELIRGELREMNPAGPIHDGLIIYLTNWSAREVSKYFLLVACQTGLDLPELESKPEPDLMWLRSDRYLKRHPSATDVKLAIEVSDSSLNSDLQEKAVLYAEAGIVEYWNVYASAQRVHVCRHPKGTEYVDRSIAEQGDRISPLLATDAVLDIAELFGVK